MQNGGKTVNWFVNAGLYCKMPSQFFPADLCPKREACRLSTDGENEDLYLTEQTEKMRLKMFIVSASFYKKTF